MANTRFIALAAAAATLALAAPRPAAAQSAIDMIEHVFGASNVNAIAGNGGLTIGVSPAGDLAVLTWPSPSYTDHLAHVASNALDVRTRALMTGHPAMGAALGLSWEDADGRHFGWLRDAPWERTQGYGDPEAAIVRTTYTHAALGLEVTVEDWVQPDADVWTRHVAVSADAAAPVTAARLILYANPAPTLSRIPQLPVADWAADAHNDFAALFDGRREAVVHFRPAGRGDLTEILDLLQPPAVDYGAVGDALAAGPVDDAGAQALIDALDADYGPGAYLALGASAPLSGHQVGFDTTPFCEVVDDFVDNIVALPELFPDAALAIDPTLANVFRCDVSIGDLVATHGWEAHVATDAFEDAADGALTGASAAAGRANEALSVDLDLTSGAADVAFYLAAAPTAAEALATLEGARATPPADHRAAALDRWRAWTRRAALPDVDDARLVDVCRRALINLKVGTDRDTGAIVASISRQAPYGLDWPRDGAFFDAALDVAGYPEMVEAHGRFYLDTLRREPAEADPLVNDAPPADPDDPDADTFPAGAWEMNYYADGMIGGFLRWEIDNTGLTVWSLLDHARYLGAPGDDGARRAWLEEVWPTVAEATDLLARWRDPATGLQAPANEDDNAPYTQTLHGAITTWLAIDRAASAADELGHADHAARYRDRADELHAAILAHKWDPDTGLFVEELDERANPGNAAGGPTSWVVWPAAFLPRDDARVVAQMTHNLGLATTRLDPAASPGGGYVTRILIPAALTLSDGASVAAIDDALQAMVAQAATPDTGVFGETFVTVDRDDDGVGDGFSARVSNPHLWAGTLVYLTAMARHAPARFDDPLGAGDGDGDASLSGGGCAGAGHKGLPAGALAALSLWLGLRRRRATAARGGSPGTR